MNPKGYGPNTDETERLLSARNNAGRITKDRVSYEAKKKKVCAVAIQEEFIFLPTNV
jgi:hypothetical protein